MSNAIWEVFDQLLNLTSEYKYVAYVILVKIAWEIMLLFLLIWKQMFVFSLNSFFSA